MRAHTYVAVSKDTGLAAIEFFNPNLARHINSKRYVVMTAAEYLPTLNKRIRDDQTDRT
jgi:hypothetical protein